MDGRPTYQSFKHGTTDGLIVCLKPGSCSSWTKAQTKALEIPTAKRRKRRPRRCGHCDELVPESTFYRHKDQFFDKITHQWHKDKYLANSKHTLSTLPSDSSFEESVLDVFLQQSKLVSLVYLITIILYIQIYVLRALDLNCTSETFPVDKSDVNQRWNQVRVMLNQWISSLRHTAWPLTMRDQKLR